MDNDSKLINEAYDYRKTGKSWSNAFTTELASVPAEGIPIEGIGTIHKYGVWANVDGRSQIVETGSDLEVLRQKYSIPPERHAKI